MICIVIDLNRLYLAVRMSLLLVIIIVIIALLLLVAMTYNQVQSFQINDYANHYVDIEITGYRALCSKTIAGRGIARLKKFGWAQQGQLTALINQCLTVILEYINFGRVQPTFGWAYSWLRP